MDVLYCLSELSGSEYKELSVHATFESCVISVYDIAIKKFILIMDKVGVHESTKYMDDLKDLNTLRHDFKANDITYLFDKRFKITKVKNYISSKHAVKNIIDHIDLRFKALSGIANNREVCFPLNIISEKTKYAWYEIDEHNAEAVIKNLEEYIQQKIDTLKLKNIQVVQGMLGVHTEDFFVVKFTDSQAFLLQDNYFGIVVSPITGFKHSLTSPKP